MKVEEAYNLWALQYDTNQNKTRDLEAVSLRNTLSKITIGNCLEIGCGTGKNSLWLMEKAKHLTAVDFSKEMLAKAREKIKSENVEFIHADITNTWIFTNKKYDLITFSLVLEHISNLDSIFIQAKTVLNVGGYVYIGELHPYKQYVGSKARFEIEGGIQVVDCFTHHLSDFLLAAKKNGFSKIDIDEYFDDNNRNEMPRILTILLKKEN